MEGSLTLCNPPPPATVLPSSPGLPDREQACRGSEPRPGPAAATWQRRWKPPCGYAQTVTETQRTAAVEGLPGPAPRPAPTPAAASRRSPHPTTALQLSGKGLWGTWGGGRGLAQPTSPAPPGQGWGAWAEQRGNGEMGLPEHLWCRAPAQPPPGSVDSVTQALTGGQKWPHVLGRPCRPLPQEARARERWTRSQQAEGWGAELLGGRTGGREAGWQQVSSEGAGRGELGGGVSRRWCESRKQPRAGCEPDRSPGAGEALPDQPPDTGAAACRPGSEPHPGPQAAPRFWFVLRGTHSLVH